MAGRFESGAEPLKIFRGLVEKSWGELPQTNEYVFAQGYLVEILMWFFEEKKCISQCEGFLSELYVSLYTVGREANARIKKIGDSALMAAGIYEGMRRASWRGIRKENFENTAKTAYGILNDRLIQATGQAILFGTLSRELPLFVRVLAHVIKDGNLYVTSSAFDVALERYTLECSEEDVNLFRAHGFYIPDKANIQ
ncbi:MAG: hypothetical protein Q8P07_01705 [bacterium]|nr:hypothetical protein [bacterium]